MEASIHGWLRYSYNDQNRYDNSCCIEVVLCSIANCDVIGSQKNSRSALFVYLMFSA